MMLQNTTLSYIGIAAAVVVYIVLLLFVISAFNVRLRRQSIKLLIAGQVGALVYGIYFGAANNMFAGVTQLLHLCALALCMFCFSRRRFKSFGVKLVTLFGLLLLINPIEHVRTQAMKSSDLLWVPGVGLFESLLFDLVSIGAKGISVPYSGAFLGYFALALLLMNEESTPDKVLANDSLN